MSLTTETFLWPQDLFIFILCAVYVCPFVYICAICMREPVGARRGSRFPGPGVTEGCKLPCGVLRTEPRLFQEQQVFVNTE